MTIALGVDVQTAPDRQALVAESQLVVTTTPAKDAVLSADCLHPGLHITAMGSDQEHKCELEPACLAKADLYVPDSQAQCAVKGELRSAIEAGLIPADRSFTELGDITAGRAAGRQSDGDLIIADLTGTGVQDTAIATLAGSRATAAGVGTTITS